MKYCVLSVFLILSLCISAENLRLCYNKPASEWTEALPMGDSWLGAMVFGSTEMEALQLNEETVWGGSPYRNDNSDALKVLPK